MNKKINKIIAVILVFLGFSLFLFMEVFFKLNKNAENHISEELDFIDQRIKSIFLEINDFPSGASDDILFLSKLSCLNDAVKDVQNDSESHSIEALRQNFLAFLKKSSAYYQIEYVDETGREIIRAEFDDENYKIVPDSELQDKKDEYCFRKTMRLDEGHVYISNVDLNVKNGEIEARGDQNNIQYVPVIKYAVPVFGGDGTRKGIIAATVYADYFLEDIRRSQRNNELTFLMDSKGYYLAHPDSNKEFAFALEERDDNFFTDHPLVANKVLMNCDERRAETDNLFFTYHCIYPIKSSFAIYEGAKKVFGEEAASDYYWVLMTVTDKGEIQENFISQKSDYLKLMLLYILNTLIIVISVILLIKSLKAGNSRLRKNNKK